MNQLVLQKYQSLKNRVDGLRKDATNNPHLAETLNKIADGLEAEADDLTRSPEIALSSISAWRPEHGG